MNRNKKILFGLIAVLALAVAYRLANPFQQETVDRLTYAPARSVASDAKETDFQNQGKVRLDLLRSPPTAEVAVRRDLFQPAADAQPSAANNRQPRQPAPPPQPKNPEQKIREHFQRFKTFGSFRHGKDTYLFLERGKQVLVVTQGDRIDGKYEVLEVAEKSVTISAPDAETPLTIDFDEL